MALNTYASLVSSISDWIHTDDVAAVTNDFIRMAEARMNTDIDVPELHKTGTVTITGGSGALPSDFSKVVSAYMGGLQLEYIDLQAANRYFAYSAGNATNYTLFGATIKVYPSSDGALALSYLANITGLSGANPTNPVLLAYPDMYLHACLIYAGQYRQDVNFSQAMESLYMADLDRVNRANWSRSSGMEIYPV